MKLSDCTEAERHGLSALEPRIGHVHLRQRLGLEGDYEAHVFRRGTHFFHLENWYSVHTLLRLALTLAGLHCRGRRNALNIQLRQRDVLLASLPKAFDGYTLLHLSDLHLDMSESHLVRLIERVRGLEYDVCVLTGDFRFRTFGPYTPALEALARLRTHLHRPTYAVLGNHDTIRMVPGMEALDIRVLMNESVRIERANEALYLAGIDDAHYFRTHNFHRCPRHSARGVRSPLVAHAGTLSPRGSRWLQPDALRSHTRRTNLFARWAADHHRL